MELKEYWSAVIAGWKVVVATVTAALLLGGVVAVVTGSPEPEFLSVRKLLLASPLSGSSDSGTSQEPDTSTQTMTYAQLLGGSMMADRVEAQLDKGSDIGIVSAIAIPGTTVIELTVTQREKDEAKEVADAYVQLLPEAIREVDSSEGAHGPRSVQVTVISSEDEPVPAAASGTLRILLLALMMGLGLGVGWALLRYTAAGQRSDRSITPASS